MPCSPRSVLLGWFPLNMIAGSDDQQPANQAEPRRPFKLCERAVSTSVSRNGTGDKLRVCRENGAIGRVMRG